MTEADNIAAVRSASLSPSSTASSTLTWLLDELVTSVAGARHAVVLSADGLVVERSGRLSRDDADQLAAMAASLHSVARGVGDRFGGGPVRQNIVEMQQAFLFVTAAGKGARLALLADNTADMGMIGYEMNRLVQRVPQHLTAASRGESVVVEGSAGIRHHG
jgi:predicted regulator of Ras-like GTPase activity (Roadblock/LC7/MglB family)